MRLRFVLALAALVAPAVPVAAKSPVNPAIVQLKSVPMTITSGARTLRYTVEVAATFEEQERGLMYRRSMPAKHGMVFPLRPERQATFWMKNTYLPLDMVFIRRDGTISSIAPNVKPMSEEITASFEPVAAVLELNAGEAQRAGIKAGDRVRW